MRLGIFGDVHNNYEALTASYKVLERAGCDQFVCTGDVVGYGASPKECINFFREHDIISVKGNHDHYTTQKNYDGRIQPYAKQVIRWMQQNILDSDDIDWLNQLPLTYEVCGVQFVHASLETADGSSWPYIIDSQTAMFHFFMQTSRFCFCGHTHIPLLFTMEKGLIVFETLTTRRFSQQPTNKYLINPGSVGQPRDFNSMASATVFDTETLDVELYRIDYDIATAQEKIIKAGLPKELAERFRTGT